MNNERVREGREEKKEEGGCCCCDDDDHDDDDVLLPLTFSKEQKIIRFFKRKQCYLWLQQLKDFPSSHHHAPNNPKLRTDDD